MKGLPELFLIDGSGSVSGVGVGVVVGSGGFLKCTLILIKEIS